VSSASAVQHQDCLGFLFQISGSPAKQHFEAFVLLTFPYSSALKYAIVMLHQHGSYTWHMHDQMRLKVGTRTWERGSMEVDCIGGEAGLSPLISFGDVFRIVLPEVFLPFGSVFADT
jgi:hypothetical protein